MTHAVVQNERGMKMMFTFLIQLHWLDLLLRHLEIEQLSLTPRIRHATQWRLRTYRRLGQLFLLVEQIMNKFLLLPTQANHSMEEHFFCLHIMVTSGSFPFDFRCLPFIHPTMGVGCPLISARSSNGSPSLTVMSSNCETIRGAEWVGAIDENEMNEIWYYRVYRQS